MSEIGPIEVPLITRKCVVVCVRDRSSERVFVCDRSNKNLPG